MFLVMDKNGETIYIDQNIGEDEWGSEAVKTIEDSSLFRADGDEWKQTGFAIVAGKPMLLVSTAIIHSDYSGPYAGSLVWGKLITDDYILGMTSVSEEDMTLSLVVDEGGVHSNTHDLAVVNDDKISGNLLLQPTLAGLASIQLDASFSRPVYQNTITSINSFLAVFASVIILSIIACLITLEAKLIRSFSFINSQIKNLDIERRLSPIVYNKTNEMSVMVNGFNLLIGARIAVIVPGGEWRTTVFAVGPVKFLLGDFAGALIDFIIIALVVFMLSKQLAKTKLK